MFIQFQRETKLCDYSFKKCEGLRLHTIFKQIPSSFLTPLNTNKKHFRANGLILLHRLIYGHIVLGHDFFIKNNLKKLPQQKKVPLPPPLSSNHFWGFTQVFYFAVLLNSVRVRVCVMFGSIICVCGKRIFCLFCWLRFSYCLRFHTKKKITDTFGKM